MSIIYTNSATGERLESNSDQTCEEILELLGKLRAPGSTLITKLPSGLGIDFNIQSNGMVWVEFYADELSSAFVPLPVAEMIVKRAFQGISGKIKESYADLISEWEY